MDLVGEFDAGFPITETTLIDIGTDEAVEHLVGGWNRQDLAKRRPGARNRGQLVEVMFRVLEPRRLNLAFGCSVMAARSSTSFPMTALVNGVEIGRYDLRREPGVYRDSIPGRLLHPGPNRLSFRLEPSAGVRANPSETARRPFVAAWDWIRLQGAQGRRPSVSTSANGRTLQVPFHSGLGFFVPVYRDARLELGPIDPEGTTDTLSGSGLEITVVLAEPPTERSFLIPRSEFGQRHRLSLSPTEGQYALVRLRAVPGDSPLALDGHLEIEAPRLVAPADALPPERGPEGSNGCRDCSVVLVSVDTLRADHVGAYGYDRDTTPNIDRFSLDAVTFYQAIAQAPSTLPSHASLFTGLLPHQHGALKAARRPLSSDAETMAEILGEEGLTTAAFASGGQLHPRWKLDQGFDLFESVDPSTRFLELVDRANDWLARNRERRFFLFLHTYEVHTPYTPRPDDLARYSSGYDGELPDEIPTELIERINGGELEIDDADLQHIIDAYDAELLNVDRGFASLIEGLREQGLYDRTMVILTSDHGEEFGEHGVVGWHSHTLYEELLRIPLIVKMPHGRWAGQRYGGISRSIDVLPTVMEVLGVNRDPDITGRSLIGPLTGRRPEPAVAVSQPDWRRTDLLPRRTVVRTRRWKFMDNGLVDLVKDRREEEDVADRYPSIVNFMRRYVGSLFLDEGLPRAGQIEMDDELLEQLRALGYVQ